MSLIMQTQQVQLRGITEVDLQQIYEKALKEFKTRVFYMDVSYGYTFDLIDFPEVRKFNLLGRYYAQDLRKLNIQWRKGLISKDNPRYIEAFNNNRLYCRTWHECLELWCDDKDVTLGGRTFKPQVITRSLDRVVNMGMEMLSGCMVGEGDSLFNIRALGDAVYDQVDLADEELRSLVDIINVDTEPDGGSLTRDGTTIMSVGNHSKDCPTPANNQFTDCAMYDDVDEDKRHVLDISQFETPIPHVQSQDAPGSTTLVYMCSG